MNNYSYKSVGEQTGYLRFFGSLRYKSLAVRSILHLSGKLSVQNENPLTSKTIILSYSIANTGIWTPIGSGTTDSAGLHYIDWLVTASGTLI